MKISCYSPFLLYIFSCFVLKHFPLLLYEANRPTDGRSYKQQQRKRQEKSSCFRLPPADHPAQSALNCNRMIKYLRQGSELSMIMPRLRLLHSFLHPFTVATEIREKYAWFSLPPSHFLRTGELGENRNIRTTSEKNGNQKIESAPIEGTCGHVNSCRSECKQQRGSKGNFCTERRERQEKTPTHRLDCRGQTIFH